MDTVDIASISDEDVFCSELFAPGTNGCHEAFDRASMLSELVGSLADHPAIRLNPEWQKIATEAYESLRNLYEKIGEVHL